MFNILLQLANNPGVLHKMRAEQASLGLPMGYKAVFGGFQDGGRGGAASSTSLTPDLLARMTYADAVIYEMLRFMPSIAGGFRQVTKTFQLGAYQVTTAPPLNRRFWHTSSPAHSMMSLTPPPYRCPRGGTFSSRSLGCCMATPKALQTPTSLTLTRTL